MPDKITAAYVAAQIAAGFTHIVVCERASIEESDALSAHRNYESARKAMHATKRANGLWILVDVQRQLSASRKKRL